MARWCAERTTEEALSELDDVSLPAGPVLTPQEVLDHEHIQAIGAFCYRDYPGLPAPAPLLRPPVSMSATPPGVHTAPPVAGAHNQEILGSLGYGVDEIAAFRAGGVI